MKNNIKIIQTRKYKDINLYLRFTIKNTNNANECLILLSKLLGDVSNKYPSKVEMTKIKDTLYGINMAVSNKARNNLLTFSVHYCFINPKFLDVSIMEYHDFIKETLFNSLINEKTLSEAKSIITDNIKRRNDKPSNLANERFNEIVSKDNPDFKIYFYNNVFIERLNSVSVKDILKVYEYILNKAQLNIYLCGDLSSDDIRILSDFNFDNRISPKLKTNKVKYNKKRTKIDKKDISQSYLSVVYTTPFYRKHKDYYKWVLANYVLGVAPTSLLFSQVREKMSLCYSIMSIPYKNEGLVKITTSIDGKNKDLVIKAIKKQVDRLINKDYDPSIVDMTKAYMINSLMGIYDDLDTLIDYYFECDLYDSNESIQEYCEKIASVTIDDIADVYKKYQHYFNYVLLGTKDEENI